MPAPGLAGGLRRATASGFVLTLFCALACQCGPREAGGDPELRDYHLLSGTATAAYDLDFDSIRAYVLGGLLVVAYERGASGLPVRNQVARLTVRLEALEALEAQAGTSISEDLQKGPIELSFQGGLIDAPPVALTRYLLTRDEFGEVVQAMQFPELRGGTVTVERLGTRVGEAVRGKFSVELMGKGETLLGGFQATLGHP